MNPFPKISLITPNFNGARFLDRTLASVTGQLYPALEYIVMDGGSTDGSAGIIQSYEPHLAHWESQPDSGMYHALNKGFALTTGEIMGWINSDDKLMPGSLFAVAEIFSRFPEVNWLQGYPVVIDESDRIVFHRTAVNSPGFFYRKGYHDGRFIQQESTFWRRSLWEKAGGHISTEYSLAGDFELWMRFFEHDRLCLTDTILGAFRFRKAGQRSRTHYDEYLAECDRIVDQCLTRLPEEGLSSLLQAHQPPAEDPASTSDHVIRFDFASYQFIKSPVTG
ncbi:MAG TPA: glycosyltransferase family 2 protein [Bacteroidales bacterium]|nr:glycosyltransferase family 2 protein [Bacteroidales bacterium]